VGVKVECFGDLRVSGTTMKTVRLTRMKPDQKVIHFGLSSRVPLRAVAE